MNTSTVWIALGVLTTFVIALIGALLRNERRMGTFMTRDEHDRICARRDSEIRADFQELRSEIREWRAQQDRLQEESQRRLGWIVETMAAAASRKRDHQ